LHVDMDAFFASVEQNERPWLERKPVIVGGDPQKRRGVVSSASYPARKYGVKAGMPVALARKLCPHATFITLTDIEKYNYIFSQLVKIFYHFTPAVEPFSIDEAFLDISGCQRLSRSLGLEIGTPYQSYGSKFGPEVWVLRLAKELKSEIKTELGLSCSVGIAPNKLLAKLASSLNKPDGLTIISKDEVKKTLYPLEVEKLWGIGEKTTRVLSKFGIRTVGDLASFPVEVLKKQFGKVGEQLHLIANGIDDSPILLKSPPEKSMGHQHTLPKDTNDPDEIFSVLLSLSSMVARRLRQKNFQGTTVTLKLRYSDFVTLTRSETIAEPTASEHSIYDLAKKLISHFDLRMTKIRLLGVSVSNLVGDKFSFQTFLPFPEYYDKKREVYWVIDKIKDRFGEDSIKWAASLFFW